MPIRQTAVSPIVVGNGSFTDTADVRQRERCEPRRRQSELAQMEDRLLRVFLAGPVDEVAFQNKSTEVKTQLREVAKGLEAGGDKAVEFFEFVMLSKRPSS